MKKHVLGLLTLSTLLSSFALQGCGNASNKIVIGLECNYAPFNWTEKTANEHTLEISNKYGQFADGYDIQIAKAIGEHLNKKVVIMKTPWESLITDLQMQSIDLVIAGMTDTEERRQSIDFTDEYYRSELVLVVNKEISDTYDSALTSEQLGILLDGKVMVSQSSTVTNDVLDNFATNYGAIHAKALDSFADCATDVKHGSAFGMTAELPVAQAIVQANPTLGIIHIDQSILGEKQAELGVSIGIRKGNDELREAVNGALATISVEQRTQLMVEAVARSSNY